METMYKNITPIHQLTVLGFRSDYEGWKPAKTWITNLEKYPF
jgi:hypothetical protein